MSIQTREELKSRISELVQLDEQLDQLKKQRSSLESAIAYSARRLLTDVEDVNGEKRFRSGPHVVAIAPGQYFDRVNIYKLGTDAEI